jgi:hypothetical protein
MDLIYPDYNCFQRGFDDPSQIRIRMEALACEEIFLMAEDKRIEMVWSLYVFSLPALRLAFGDCSVLSVPMLPVSS